MSQDLATKSTDLNLLLKARAQKLKEARLFFETRGVLEADVSLLSPYTNIDDHIDPIEVSYLNQQKGYLHTSPELALKKLLAQGSGDIYYLGPVFRDHEKGHRHRVEFTMVEWYRHRLSFSELIQETLDFIRLFIGPKKAQIHEYRDLFHQATDLWVEKATRRELLECIQRIDSSLDFSEDSQSDLEIFIFSNLVEPTLEDQGLVVVQYYPEGQAALAKTEMIKDVKVARRFEIYDKGLELANGYDEMRGSSELLRRYEQLNHKRLQKGKEKLPIDPDFLKANEALPDCRGVSVGFDRVFMRCMNCEDIRWIHPQ